MSIVRYYPLNRIRTGLKTAGGEFTLNGKNYVGPYYSTYDGLFFTGVDSLQGPSELLLVAEGQPQDSKNRKPVPPTYDKINYKSLLITKPQNKTSFTVLMVFGGITYANKQWMLDQVTKGQKAMLNNGMIAFADYTTPYSTAKKDLVSYIKENNYIQTGYSIAGFSAGGINAMDGYIAESGRVALLGLIDPSINRNIFNPESIKAGKYDIVTPLGSNIRMVYNYTNWTAKKNDGKPQYPTNYYTMRKVAAAIKQAGGNIETPQDVPPSSIYTGNSSTGAGAVPKVPAAHSKIPAYYFQTYYNYITVTINSTAPVISPSSPLPSLPPPPSHYPRISEDDYKVGYVNRYFAKKRERPGYVIEISEQVFKSMRNNVQEYDYINYETEIVTWKLVGPVRDVVLDQYNTRAGIESTNSRVVESKDSGFRGLKDFIGGEYTKYSRITT